jgi:pyridoxamine 5'-phosphate oxidase
MADSHPKKIIQIPLTETDALDDPFAQFDRWFDEATDAGVPLPNAMTLATVTATGRPSARVVLLKGVEGGAFVFFTNYESRKGRELAAKPYASLVFHWSQFDRQVRVEGSVEKVSAEESDAYVATRPVGSRLSSWASPQSEVVPDRAWLETRLAEASERYGKNVPRPPHWGGYRVVPEEIEFWQGRNDRLHDRLVYRIDAQGGWLRKRLAP